MSDARPVAEQPTAAEPLPATDRRELIIDAAWFLMLAIWSASWCLSAAERLGPTYDELFYLGAGLEHWRSGVPERTTTHGVMPMPVQVVTLPLNLHERFSGETIKDVDGLFSHLNRARVMTLGWLWLLLAAAMRLGQAMAGPWAGRIAAGLIAADPNFLAHSSLATTDVCVAASLMAFTLVVYTGRNGGLWARVMYPGVWYGIAATCKLSGLLYGGFIIVGLEIAYRIASGGLSRPAGASLSQWGLHFLGAVMRSVLAVAAVVVIGVSLAIVLCGTPPPGSKPMAQLPPKIPDSEPLKPKVEQIAAKYPHASYAIVAFVFQSWHNSSGRPAFLNGTYYPAGCWFYFPVLIAMKTPLPVWLLGLAALVRPRVFLNPLTLAVLLLLGVTLNANLQTGIRLVLPIVAIGYVTVAVMLCRAFERSGRWLGLTAVIVTAAISVFIWPNGLGYLNQAFGGPAAARHRVSDSNLDWGQGVPELLKWHKAHGEPPMAVWYFGTDSAAAKAPLTQLFIEGSPIRTEEEFKSVVGPRLLAVGETVLSLHPFDPPPKGASMRYLLKLKPIARTTTFAIYDFRGDLPPASP